MLAVWLTSGVILIAKAQNNNLSEALYWLNVVLDFADQLDAFQYETLFVFDLEDADPLFTEPPHSPCRLPQGSLDLPLRPLEVNCERGSIKLMPLADNPRGYRVAFSTTDEKGRFTHGSYGLAHGPKPFTVHWWQHIEGDDWSSDLDIRIDEGQNKWASRITAQARYATSAWSVELKPVVIYSGVANELAETLTRSLEAIVNITGPDTCPRGNYIINTPRGYVYWNEEMRPVPDAEFPVLVNGLQFLLTYEDFVKFSGDAQLTPAERSQIIDFFFPERIESPCP